MKKYCLYLAGLLSIVSCNKETSELSSLYVPDLIDKNIVLNLNDVFSTVSYIALESNKAIYMNRINDLIVDDDFILAHDKRGNKLLQFDKSGKFIKEYMKYGRGPEEFFQIRSIDVNENKEILVLRDAKYLDIKTEQGNLLNSIEFETCPMSAKWLTTNIIILFYPYPFYLFNNQEYEICFIDREGKMLMKRLKRSISGSDKGSAEQMVCERNGDEFYYWSHRSDTIFTINQKMEVFPRYVLQHDNRHFPAGNSSTSSSPMSYENRYFVEYYHEWADYIFIFIVYNHQGYRGIINKKHGLCGNVIQDYNQWTERGLLNNIDGGISFWPSRNLFDGSAIKVIDPIDLLETYEYNKNSNLTVDLEKQKQLKKELLDKLTIYSNPILMKVK